MTPVAADSPAPIELTFDITASIGGEDAAQAAWLFLPPNHRQAQALLVCFAGGSYDKRYWHLEVPGHTDYSFARYLAHRGYVVVAVDHLGVGESSDPVRSGELGMPLLAKGDASVLRALRDRLANGSLSSELPKSLPMVGVGHSMGSCLAMMAQVESEACDALVLLGYGIQIVSRHEVDTSAGFEPAITERMMRLRATFGVSTDATSGFLPREPIRALFHAPDVPDEVVAADSAAESRVPIRAAAEVTTAGYAEPCAAAIGVPIFLAFGAAGDVSPDPHREPANYPNSTDVTLFLVDGSAHCHNFAGARLRLWDRIDAWIQSLQIFGGTVGA